MKQILARFPIVILLVFGVAILLTACDTSPAPAAKTVTILAGVGKDTVDVNAFFPSAAKIRVGDTVTWKLNSDEIHTVTFSDGKAPPGTPPQGLIPDPRFGATAKDVVPYFAIPVPSGGPTDFMITPALAFPSRAPGAPVEKFDGAGYANSGILSNQPPAPNVPPDNTFSLTFSKPGTYQYLCLVHLSPMLGTVEVVAETATDVPTQADIDTKAKSEIEPLLGLIEKAKAQVKEARKDPAPNNTTTWYVKAGANEFVSGDQRVQLLEFGPKTLTIKAGDTVIWGSTYFHTITFNPTPPPPEFVIPKPQPQGPPLLTLNPQVGAPIKPSPAFDPTKYYNSGVLGPFSDGSTWSLIFDKPGTYDYFCVLHREQGMKATVVVQPK